MYWIDLYKDIRTWITFSRVAKENRKFLEEHKMRVDKLGRIYSVLNLPPEVDINNDYMCQGWVIQNLKPFTEVLLKIGLADFAYPEISKIETPGAAAYLVVMYPEATTITLTNLIKNIAIYGLSLIALRIIYKLLIQYVDFASIWHSIQNII